MTHVSTQIEGGGVAGMVLDVVVLGSRVVAVVPLVLPELPPPVVPAIEGGSGIVFPPSWTCSHRGAKKSRCCTKAPRAARGA